MASRIFCRTLTALSIILFSTLAFSNEEKNFAKLPYDSLFQLQEKVSEGLSHQQQFFLHIISNDPTIQSNDISIDLVSNNEKVAIKIDHRGFFDLPIRKDLIGKEAFIVST